MEPFSLPADGWTLLVPSLCTESPKVFHALGFAQYSLFMCSVVSATEPAMKRLPYSSCTLVIKAPVSLNPTRDPL